MPQLASLRTKAKARELEIMKAMQSGTPVPPMSIGSSMAASQSFASRPFNSTSQFSPQPAGQFTPQTPNQFTPQPAPQFPSETASQPSGIGARPPFVPQDYPGTNSSSIPMVPQFQSGMPPFPSPSDSGMPPFPSPTGKSNDMPPFPSPTNQSGIPPFPTPNDQSANRFNSYNSPSIPPLPEVRGFNSYNENPGTRNSYDAQPFGHQSTIPMHPEDTGSHLPPFSTTDSTSSSNSLGSNSSNHLDGSNSTSYSNVPSGVGIS